MINPELHLDQEAAQRIASLMREERWRDFAEYIRKIRAMAEKQLKNRKNTLTDFGYWAGVTQICEDIEQMPEGIARQLYSED